MIIRRFAPPDLPAVHEVIAQAFRSAEEPDALPIEVGLFHALLDAGDVVAELNMVAVDGASVLGHVVCSHAFAGAHRVVGLGPIGVLPERQGAGVGSALMHAAVGASDALGIPLVGLLGSPGYYSRFGFEPAANHSIVPPDPAWGEYFQVRLLTAYDQRVSGAFRYARAFDDLPG